MKGTYDKKTYETNSSRNIQSSSNMSNSEGCYDTLVIKIKSVRIIDEQDPNMYGVKVIFQDQLILYGFVKALDGRAPTPEHIVLVGSMIYDPSNYEKMSSFADSPLNVCIAPQKPNDSSPSTSPRSSKSVPSKFEESSRSAAEDKAYCCNVDILPLFIDKDEMRVEKRLEPLYEPGPLHLKSWDNLPIITLDLEVHRNKQNEAHHKVLKRANYMKLTLIAAYNMIMPYDEDYFYTAATNMPINNHQTHINTVTFDKGRPPWKRFNGMCFYPQWDSLRVAENIFKKSSRKFVGNISDLQNNDEIALENYMENMPDNYTVVWGSFHRSLFLEEHGKWLWRQWRGYCWPFELHVYNEREGISYMGFLDLFQLIYPGESTVRLAIPLKWLNSEAMVAACGCDTLLLSNDKGTNSPFKNTARGPINNSKNNSTSDITNKDSGASVNCAFVVIEVQLGRPLRQIQIPSHIENQELKDMLKEFELSSVAKRACTGRGQLNRNWHSTMKSAAQSIKKMPHNNMTEFCILNRQLSETRTRVELSTSFWQDAAVYVNNNFAVHNFMQSDEMFEEMLMMAHTCLTKAALETLVGTERTQVAEPVLLAARQARQMQDTQHAMEIYLQLVSQKPRDGDCWRELSTCLMDVDRDWSNVCINKAVLLNPRNALSLLAKGARLFEEDPDLAEPFFVALLADYPRWTTLWVIARAYYIERELFHVAETAHQCCKQTIAENLIDNKVPPRAWNHELGDWWEQSPLLPGMSKYLDAADLLLRLRAMTLAEACLSRALVECGESATYFHLVALCCRLRGDYQNALCHIKTGIQNYGEISYLRSLEAEIYHKLNNIPASEESFRKAGSALSPHSTLLSLGVWEPQRVRTLLIDLVRRQPSAYSWLALAEDWMESSRRCKSNQTEELVAAKGCAKACAVKALQWDRRAGRAWSLLTQLVHPSARRLHCNNMLEACGYKRLEQMEYDTASRQTLCFHLGKSLRGCRCLCDMCKNIRV